MIATVTRRPAAPVKPWAAPVQAPAASAQTLTAREVEMLTRAVAAEARGESYEVQMAVAQAILNYARKHKKPIEKLVRSSFLSSNFDQNRRFYTMPTAKIPNYERMQQAVLAAGRGESPIGKRDHFYDISIKMPRWGDARSQLRIGRMVFLNERR